MSQEWLSHEMTGHGRRAKRLISDGRVRSVLTVSLGNATSALLNVIVVPLVASQYSPTAFGLAAAVVLVSGVLGTANSGRYEVGAAVAEHSEEGDSESASLANLACILAVLTTIPVQLVTIAVVTFVGGADPCWNWLALLALTNFGASLQMLLDTRRGAFRVITSLTATRPLFFLAAAMGFAAVFPGPLSASSLCAAYVFAGLPPTIRALWLLRNNASKYGWRLSLLRETAQAHRKYPRYQVPAALLNNLASSLFGLTLGGLFGATALGAYTLSTRITLLPAAILGGPMNTVYLREAVLVREQGSRALKLYRLTLAAALGVGLAALPLLLTLTPLIVEVLGTEWSGVGSYVVATVPLMFSQLITSPPNSALMAYSAQREIFRWRLFLALTPLLGLGMAYILGVSAAYAVFLAGIPLLLGTILYAVKARGVIRRGEAGDVVGVE